MPALDDRIGNSTDSMSNSSRTGFAAALALVAAGCAGGRSAQYNPFRVPRDSFYGSLKVVALAPLRVPSDLKYSDEVRSKFEGMIEQELRSAGLQVVPPAQVGPVIEAARVDAGALFDPMTGKPVAAKVKALDDDVRGRVQKAFGADAILRPDLRVVMARLQRDTAAWDGVFEGAATSGWKSLVVTHSGRIPALTLVVRLVRVDGADLYEGTGGLRVISRVGIGGKPEPIPQAELFSDEDRNATAVHLAMDPLLGRKFVPAQGGTVDSSRL
jgi:hypothetical protein